MLKILANLPMVMAIINTLEAFIAGTQNTITFPISYKGHRFGITIDRE